MIGCCDYFGSGFLKLKTSVKKTDDKANSVTKLISVFLKAS